MGIFRCSALFFVFSTLGHACPISVTSQGVTVGTNQSAAIRNANTSALNTMFARVNNGELPCHGIEFPEGVIEISGVIHVDGTAITIAGINRERSIIMQTAANQPVFSWNSENRYVTGIYVHDLGFDNANNRPPYHPAQWGLQFRCTADGTAGNSWGFANSQFERLCISHMYVGLGVYTQNSGVCGLWSTHFSDIKIDNSQRNAIYLVGGQIGQPANLFDRIDILQENSPPLNTPAHGDNVDAAAFFAVGANGLLINSLDIEGWNATSAEVEIYGGAATVINNLRVEHAMFTGCNPTIAFFDADVVLNGTSINWDKFANTCPSYVFSLAGASTNLLVNGLKLASTVGPPAKPLTMWRVDKPDPPAKIFANSLNLNGLATEWVPSTDAGLTTSLYSRYAIDQMPPKVDKLPAAAALYLGRWFLCAGKVYRCRQNAAGAYEWTTTP
jgi:hypothetical protein